ncbi:DNA-binding transcriptional LysR family regulator [Sphingomonas naasensis]|uniref:LysR family transcriptional regulator n=1 Tax=Sphingomonas naasensis TaxID=1344951 RepID=A0A4S1W5L0_9SPHN|nr:LysR family transcriptional regulator [Sphingomonas naasensis]NIJ20695.1 DNA-binding transcriptional LysR family regulator [Sphingomonas naasensis]TGX37583.1 LysR family transcriptional regulator [Sphingomonas naasensis]
MNRQHLAELSAFLGVARERSFTRAAAQLGVTPSALSHSMRALEERLGLRLLNRTTRSVTPTEAGERLLRSVGPRFDEVEAELASLSALRDKPAGNVRISADEHSLKMVLWPALRRVLPEYPDIHVEIVTDYTLTDIVAERFDAGVRFGEIIAKDMIAVPIAPEARMLAVASPAYFDARGRPDTLEQLTDHNCLNLRLPTYGGLYAWEFTQNGRELRVRVEGQLVFSSILPILEATLDGFGIAYLPLSLIQPHLDSGALEAVLSEWSPPFPGYHLYYPSRRQPTPAFATIVEALRYRG